jgi:hypothetical protein
MGAFIATFIHSCLRSCMSHGSAKHRIVLWPPDQLGDLVAWCQALKRQCSHVRDACMHAGGLCVFVTGTHQRVCHRRLRAKQRRSNKIAEAEAAGSKQRRVHTFLGACACLLVAKKICC